MGPNLGVGVGGVPRLKQNCSEKTVARQITLSDFCCRLAKILPWAIMSFVFLTLQIAFSIFCKANHLVFVCLSRALPWVSFARLIALDIASSAWWIALHIVSLMRWFFGQSSASWIGFLIFVTLSGKIALSTFAGFARQITLHVASLERLIPCHGLCFVFLASLIFSKLPSGSSTRKSDLSRWSSYVSLWMKLWWQIALITFTLLKACSDLTLQKDD